jgi:hypothetical protein
MGFRAGASTLLLVPFRRNAGQGVPDTKLAPVVAVAV